MVNDVTTLLLPVMEATIKLTSKNMKVEPIQIAVHDMQLAIYWLKAAEKLNEQDKQETLTTDSSSSLPVRKLPTLLGSLDSFNYINNQLKDITTSFFEYKENTEMNPSLKYHLDRGYDNLMNAYFNIQIAQIYHGEINKQ